MPVSKSIEVYMYKLSVYKLSVYRGKYNIPTTLTLRNVEPPLGTATLHIKHCANSPMYWVPHWSRYT